MIFHHFQTSTVYVDAAIFKFERLLHPHLPLLPPVVIARISKLPSPMEKENVEQKLKKNMQGKDRVGKTESEKLKSESNFEPDKFKNSCYVRVVGVHRQALFADEAWKDAADRLLSEQTLMWGQ